MKITSSDISMSSQYSYVESSSQSEALNLWVLNPDASENSDSNPSGVVLQISERARELQQVSVSSLSATSDDDDSYMLSGKDKVKVDLIEAMLSAYLGKKVRLHVLPRIKLDPKTLQLQKPVTLPQLQPQQQPSVNWGLTYNYSESHYEKEKMAFNADGVIKTADGREISIDVSLKMSREFISRTDISVRAGAAAMTDPLVINFGGNAAELTQTKFDFDIDTDGKADQISFVGKGSGFLALDLNADGKINDGSELFGPKSGDGFADLSAYDTDKNGWIDENDPVFEKLRIWTKDENGSDQLFALGQKGIGAIYLGNVNTDFALKDAGNNLEGQIQQTGIFLNEDGTAGTIQHIDLAV